MILGTMNDDEKCYEAFRVVDWIYDIYKRYHLEVEDRFKRGTRFPYIQRIQVEDDKKNIWYIWFCCPSKAARKHRGMYFSLCYTIYDIPPKRKENNNNSGKGIIIYDFLEMRNFIKNKNNPDVKQAVFMDIVPHAFNRYTERYLKPNGKDDIEFHKKIDSMFLRWRHFDIEADLVGDKSAKKHKENCICPYDVFMSGGGMLRGQIVNGMLLRFYTYVSEEMMFDGQLERQDEMFKERLEWERKGYIKT